MDDQARADAFYAHVMGGGKVEADDWMPDDYRAAVLKFVEMHANSELMGVLPEREWILRAPTLKRKLALTSKVRTKWVTPSSCTEWPRTWASPASRCSTT